MTTPPVSGSGASLTGRVGRDWAALAALGLAYAALFAARFPPVPGIEDEVEFINQATVWSGGHLSAEAAGFDRLAGFVPAGGRSVAWRNPGRPLLAVPFVWLAGTAGAFASGAVVHLATAAALAGVMARLGRPPLWGALALFHPTLALYSRAVMADGACGLFALLGLRAALGDRAPGARAGLLLGLATACRYQFAVAVPAAAVVVWAVRRGRGDAGRQTAGFLLAAGACGAALAGYNWVALGTPAGFTHQGYFAASFVPGHLGRYALSLALVWPGLLAAPFLVRGPAAWYAHAVAWPLLGLLLPYYWMDRGGSAAQDLVLALRLFLPGVAALLVPYAVGLDRLARAAGRAGPAAAAVGLAAMAGPTAAVFDRHQAHLLALAAARDEVRGAVPAGSYVLGNSTAAKLFAVPDAGRLRYRWAASDPAGEPVPAPPAGDWYVVTLSKDGAPFDAPRAARGAEPVPTRAPGLTVLRVPGPAPPAGP